MTDLIQPHTIDVAGVSTTFPREVLARPTSFRLRMAVKRTADIVLATAGIILALPVLLLIGLAVRLDSRGPALFRQTRVGAGGRHFRMIKFRTMVDGAEAVLAAHPALLELHKRSDFKLPIEHDPRVTRVGRFLRRSSIDELPQLWNVLLGHMSLVGVRPVEPDQVPELYREHQRVYTQMRPGLTGLWQVSGRSHVANIDRAELDVYYVENWSLGLDARVALKTLPVVLQRHGAH